MASQLCARFSERGHPAGQRPSWGHLSAVLAGWLAAEPRSQQVGSGCWQMPKVLEARFAFPPSWSGWPLFWDCQASFLSLFKGPSLRALAVVTLEGAEAVMHQDGEVQVSWWLALWPSSSRLHCPSAPRMACEGRHQSPSNGTGSTFPWGQELCRPKTKKEVHQGQGPTTMLI